MKATGIIRRVDDLGRMVIPNGIRRALCIREGTPLEFFLNEEGGITLRKYSPLRIDENIITTAKRMAAMSKLTIAIYDNNDKLTGCETFPKHVLSQWEDLREVSKVNEYYIYPILSNREKYGYVVSEQGGAEITMIQRYLSAELY